MTYDAGRFPFSSLLPQTGAMRLLDRLLVVTDESATAQLTIDRHGLFCLPDGGVPAWVGLEYMAQTIAAWSGYHCLRQGEPIRVGLLLGTRLYQSQVAVFASDSTLQVQVHRVFAAANDMSVFECRIEGDGTLARARLNVLLPADMQPCLDEKQEAV